ncbi:MAG: tetratricopeptide repeat protein [Spirochaetaceae bacterium]|nr:tetratricopeptide repeat protein [Spirochaetaceae bacterium]
MDTAIRPPKHEAEEKKTFNQKLADFLRKYRTILLAVLVAAVVAVVGVAVWTAVSNSRANASTARVERLTEDMSAWAAEQDAAKKAEAEKALVAGLDEVVATWSRSFAAGRALAMRARLNEEKKDWAAAEKDWNEAAARFPKTFLAPVAIQNAAAAAEERGAAEAAAAYYKRLVDNYSGKSVGIPHAYFSLGRLAEESKDYAAALGHYEKIVASYPDDDWTKLAKDRILFLKSRGLAK